MDDSVKRQLLAGAARKQRAVDDDPDEALARVVAIAPGKRTRAASPEADLPTPAAPTRAVPRVDRRADPAHGEVDDGALASAVSFIETATAGPTLPPELAQRLAAELRVDLDRVRLHTDASAAKAAAALGARAFTIGDDIYFAAGAYDPHGAAGIQLIAHEMAHVSENQRGQAPTGRQVSHPDDQHERRADSFAQHFSRTRVDSNDPAVLVEHVRRQGQRMPLPLQQEMEAHFGTSLDFVETFGGEAAELACRLMEAGAFAVRNVVALADPSPQRETLLHELTHVMQMGGRAAAAPKAFVPGSLRVGARASAVEDEAAHHAAQPSHRADPDTVHRADPKPTTPTPVPVDPAKAQDRVKAYCESATLAGPAKDQLHWGNKESAARCSTRYYTAQDAPFKTDAYVTASKGDKADLETAFSAGWANAVGGGGYRLHRVEGSSDTFVISKAAPGPSVPWKATVTRLTIQDKPKWAAFAKACTEINVGGKGPIKFTWPKDGGTLHEDDPPISGAELEDYRRALRTAVATAYASADGKFGLYYKEVCQAKKFDQKTQGSIFEELVALSAGDGIDGAAATNAIPVWDKRDIATATILGTMKKNRLDGDGVIEMAGAGVMAITETKSYAKGGGPTASDKKKMGEYYTLITGKTPGYVKKGDVVEQVVFNHAAYHIAVPDPVPNSSGKPEFDAKTKADLEKWLTELGTAFKEPAKPVGGAANKGATYSAGKWSLHPPPDGSFEFKVKFNPELAFEVPASTKSINLADPAVKVPGLKVTNVKASLDDSHQVTSGSVTFGVDAGDLSKAPQTKPLTPNKEGSVGGQVDNKVTGLKSKLTEYLPVDIDAAIVDDGVEATIKLKQGAAKGLAGFTVEAAQIKATYKGGGTLTVDADIGIKHTNGKISGRVKVGYDNGWSFEGSVKVSDGFIPGVGEFEAHVSKSADGEWIIGADTVTFEKQFGAIKLNGSGNSLEYNTKTGMFKGAFALAADLGMFGKASGSATIENNKLTKGSLSYDSPEFKYPAKSAKPGFVGTVGGTVKFDDGKFSGDIKGSANVNIPALQKLGGDNGVGLAVDAHIKSDGNYSGTIKSLGPLKFGKHLEIPSVSCTLEDDGSVSGAFEIAIVGIKNLTTAKAKCTVDKSGITVEDASATVAFGDEGKGKLWGSITAGYSSAKGFDVGGTANYKIKEDVVATGTIKYSQETNAIDLDLKVSEITLMDKKMSKQLFKASKQIPVVNVYGLGIYVDLGFDLGFDFGFKLTMTPSAKVEGFALDTLEFKKIAAKLAVGGDIYAQLTGTPKLGIGVFALDPSIIRGGGGLKVPIVGRLDIKPKADFGVEYAPGGGVTGSAKLGLAGEFGIKGSVKPYAEFSVLNDVWNPKWEGAALSEFEILKPKELFNFTVDLTSDEKQKDPELPGQNAAKEPSAPTGDKTAKAEPKAPTERGGEASKSQPAKQGEVAESGNEGPFSLSALMGKLKSIPGFATAEKLFKYAQKIWKVVKPIYDIVEPLMDMIAKRIEEIIGLFDPGPGSDLGGWLWKLAKVLFNLSFGGIVDVARAIRTLLGKAAAFAKKLVNKAVQDGQLGVKRHSYYIWRPWPMDNYEFMAAAQYKINIPSVASLSGGPDSFLLQPGSAVALVLYEALGAVGVGYTYTGKSDIGQPYNDIWTGGGARG